MTKAEIKKQFGDQSLHIIIGATVTHMVSTLVHSWVGAIPVIVGWVIWEVRQWPSSRWWDPYLDWFFQAAGVGIGIWWYL